jgi:lipopolysaccharide/colanic/teichoic acid biosynthesis glycosyltransferase
LAVRPGLTDPASIEHLDEGERLATSNDPEQTYLKEILPTKLALQADYLRRASFRSDVQVLLLTLRRLFGR